MPHSRIFVSTTFAVSCLILPCPSSTSAQSTCDWARVRALRPGQAITVNTAPGQSISGRLVTMSATDLTIAAGGAPMAAIGALIVHSEKPRHGLIYRHP